LRPARTTFTPDIAPPLGVQDGGGCVAGEGEGRVVGDKGSAIGCEGKGGWERRV
jgi:hypothetical protein